MTASSTTHAPRPFTKEELAKLLETFTVDEVAFIVEQRARKSKDPYQAPPSPSSLGPSGVAKAQHIFEPLPWWFDEWAGQRFYVPDRLDPYSFTPTTVTGPVVMMFWQKVVTRFLLDINRPYDRFYQNIIISTLKKTGKSLLAAAIGRWIAETWGNYSEVICLGSDKDQAEDKLYAAITKSIELDPGYDSGLQTLFSLAISPDDPDPYNPTLWIPDYTRPLWRLRSDGAQYIPNHGTIKAVPRVYKKLAGGNQTAAIFTEMWTWNGVDAQRLVDEMTPPPTRPRSIRLMEGYAGFEGESGIWEDFWDKAMNPKLGGRMVTREELEPYGGWPFPPTPQAFKENDYAVWRDHPDPIPLYVNDSLRIGAFIDQGEAARRMPWQTPEYYETQRLDESYDRHHRNVQSAHKEEFVPKHWWDACNVRNHPAYVRRKDRRNGLPLPPVHESLRTIPPLLPNEPAVMAVDGSVDSDCTALMIVSYACTWDYLDAEPNHLDPTVDQRRKRVYDESHVMVRYMRLWEPTKEHPMNHTTMVKPEILRWHGYYQPDPDVDDYEVDPNGQEYNIVEVVYDQYQLHDLMINLRNDYGIWVKVFSQQTGRDMADKDLYDAIRDRKLWHDGDPTLDAHRAGAARRRSKNIGSSTENRTHLVKKNGRSKIDLFVVASMGRFEMARLDA